MLAMESLEKVGSQELLTILENNVEASNIQRIGVHNNTTHPATQANIAPTVAYVECNSMLNLESFCYASTHMAPYISETGLQGMGDFGAVSGHCDLHDSEGSLTFMISGSRFSSDYEAGHFHLHALGIYVKLEFLMVTHFCGLNLHGGTPPIAPKGSEVVPHAHHLMFIYYTPSSMLSGPGNMNNVTPLASLPKGVVLNLGPEITTLA